MRTHNPMNPDNKGKPDFEGGEVGRVPRPPPKWGHSPPSKVRSLLILAIGLAIPILAIVFSLEAWNFNERLPKIDDAGDRKYLTGTASHVAGHIIYHSYTH